MMTDNIRELTLYKIAVGRKKIPVAQHYYDIYCYSTGLLGQFRWRANHFRIVGVSMIMDYLSRFSRRNLTPKEASEVDEESFYFDWANVQGIVSYNDHKELMIRTNEEVITLLPRSEKAYYKLLDHLKKKFPDKLFSRNDVELVESAYEGNNSKVEVKMR